MAGVRPPTHSLECLALALNLTQADLAERFTDLFTKASPSPSVAVAETSSRNEGRTVNLPAANALDAPFTQNELLGAIRALRSRSTPGPDGCSNRSQRNLRKASLLASSLRTTISGWLERCRTHGNQPRSSLY